MGQLNSAFQIQWRGEVLVVIPSGTVEDLSWDLIEQAAEIVMQPIRAVQHPSVIFDLGEMKYIGSVFLSLILRCYKHVKSRRGELALCRANQMAKELLRITALDSLWPIYDTREEALMILQGDDE